MINIKDIIDNLFFLMFKRYIFKNDYKKIITLNHFQKL